VKRKILIMDIKDKPEFDYFMQRALASFKSGAGTDDCYIELYNILLRAFVSADVDFDGKIGVEEFDQMIENAASLPRKFGYKWWGEETYADDASRIKAHEDLFKSIDENGDGAVSFDEWLAYSLKQCVDKSNELPTAMDESSKDAFIAECKASATPGSEAHRKLYWFNVKCFQLADADRDGMVSGDEFDKMIEAATSTQKRLGLPVPFATSEERQECFKKMDENGDGSVSFDEWLKFSVDEIINKIASM